MVLPFLSVKPFAEKKRQSEIAGVLFGRWIAGDYSIARWIILTDFADLCVWHVKDYAKIHIFIVLYV